MSAAPSQLARDASECHSSVAKENARIRQQRAAQTRQYEAWDKLLKTDAWQDYTANRGLEIRHVLEGLPHAPEAEAACLGAALISGRACRLMLSQTKPPCFGRAFNRTIWRACGLIVQRAAQEKQRVKVDIVTVSSELRRHGKWQDGMSEYLSALIEGCPSAVNVRAYIREILECSRLRHQIELAEKIRTVAFAGAHPDQIANASRRALDELDLRGYCDLKTIFEECK